MRKIVLFATLGVLISSGAWAQDNYGMASPANSQQLIQEQELQRMGKAIQEYREGKRSDEDGYVALYRYTLACAKLKLQDNPDCKKAVLDFTDLQTHHLDFRTKYFSGKNPLELSEEKQNREAGDKKEQEIKEKAKTFVPKDIHMAGAGLYGANDLAIAVYQYRLEFYHLPQGMSWREMKIYQGAMEVPPTKFVNIIRPDKIMTFKHPFSFRPLRPATFDHPFWVCTNLLAGYIPRGSDEEELLKGSPIPWVNETGHYEDFCGAIGLDGKIIYQLSIKQELPGKLLSLRMVSEDGKKALLFLGAEVTDQAGESMEVGKLRKALVWEYPDKISEFNPNDQTRLMTLLLEMRHKNHRKK